MAVAAVFFDVDGTLVPGTSSSHYLAGFLGHREALSVAEAEWDAGVVGNRAVEFLDAAGWAGTSHQQVREWLGGLPLVDGVAEVVAWCVRNDVLPVLATLAWHPVGDFLCQSLKMGRDRSLPNDGKGISVRRDAFWGGAQRRNRGPRGRCLQVQAVH